jgi:hypothetical protein
VDATLVAAPRQRNTEAEKAAIKAGKSAGEIWPEKAAKGTVRNFVLGRSVDHNQAMALVKRSPNRIANWALAFDHSRGGIFHSFSSRIKAR